MRFTFHYVVLSNESTLRFVNPFNPILVDRNNWLVENFWPRSNWIHPRYSIFIRRNFIFANDEKQTELINSTKFSIRSDLFDLLKLRSRVFLNLFNGAFVCFLNLNKILFLTLSSFNICSMDFTCFLNDKIRYVNNNFNYQIESINIRGMFLFSFQ
jgi:hypothetical protein